MVVNTFVLDLVIFVVFEFVFVLEVMMIMAEDDDDENEDVYLVLPLVTGLVLQFSFGVFFVIRR